MREEDLTEAELVICDELSVANNMNPVRLGYFLDFLIKFKMKKDNTKNNLNQFFWIFLIKYK